MPKISSWIPKITDLWASALDVLGGVPLRPIQKKAPKRVGRWCFNPRPSHPVPAKVLFFVDGFEGIVKDWKAVFFLKIMYHQTSGKLGWNFLGATGGGDLPQWGRYSLHALSGLAYSPAHCLFDAGLKAQLLVWYLVARRCVAARNSMARGSGFYLDDHCHKCCQKTCKWWK